MHMRNDMATLEKFLRTGELGSIHPGMTQAEVVALLEAPRRTNQLHDTRKS